MSDKTVIRRRLLHLTFPIFIETLLIVLLGTMDTIMLSRFSDNAVASVGVVNQVFNMIIIVFQVTTLGTTVLCSQYIGASQKEKFTQVIGISLLFNLLLGLFISLLLYFKSELFLQWMHLPPELMDDGVRYMRIVGGFAFVQSISLTISAVLRSANLGKYSMYVTLIINVLNAAGNYLLIFGNHGFPVLGAKGAAIATTASRVIATILLLILLYKHLMPRIPRHLFFPFPFSELKKLLRIGMPAAGEQMSYSLSQVVVTMFINMISIEAVTTRTYVMNIVMFTYLFALSVSLGNSILVGQLIGENRKEDAFRICLDSLKGALFITGIIAGAIAAGGMILLGLLTENQRIIELGAIILLIDFLLEFGRCVNMMMVNALRSTGDANFPVLLGLFSMWLIATGLSWIFGIWWGWGLIGMWIAFTLDECFRAVILVKRWKSKKWMAKNLITPTGQPLTEESLTMSTETVKTN